MSLSKESKEILATTVSVISREMFQLIKDKNRLRETISGFAFDRDRLLYRAEQIVQAYEKDKELFDGLSEYSTRDIQMIRQYLGYEKAEDAECPFTALANWDSESPNGNFLGDQMYEAFGKETARSLKYMIRAIAEKYDPEKAALF